MNSKQNLVTWYKFTFAVNAMLNLYIITKTLNV